MTILGKDPQGNNIEISQHDRLTAMYVIGKNGQGKSTMLENMIVEDIHIGMGLCVLDPHGDMTNNIICRCPQERLDDIILFDPILLSDKGYYPGLNLYECHNMQSPPAVEYAVEQVVQIYKKVFGMSSADTPRLEQYVRNIGYTFVGTDYTMADISKLFLNKPFRDKVVKNITDDELKLFWDAYEQMRPADQLEDSKSTRNRMSQLISNTIIRHIVGQSKTTLNFSEIFDSGKILLISLSARYESLTSLLGSIIIGQLLMAALSRAKSEKRQQFNLYADEYQRFATPDFATLLTEARKFGIATTIAHQVRGQLDEQNASTALNAGSLVCFRITSEDAEELAPEFLLEPKKSQTIPRNCLDYIDRHQNDKVREFSGTYIHTLQDALRIKNDYIGSPLYNFGEGTVSFQYKHVQEALNIIQACFYDAMKQGKRVENNGVYLIQIMSGLLEFPLVYKRKFLKDYGEILPKEEHYERLKHDEEYRKKYGNFEEELNTEIARYLRFIEPFQEVEDILIKEPIYATSADTGEYTSSTFADKKNELANKLTHLSRGHAMVKLPTGEYDLETIVPNTNRKHLEERKTRILNNTIKNYCRSVSEIDEEIRNRQYVADPPQSTTRKHVV